MEMDHKVYRLDWAIRTPAKVTDRAFKTALANFAAEQDDWTFGLAVHKEYDDWTFEPGVREDGDFKTFTLQALVSTPADLPEERVITMFELFTESKGWTIDGSYEDVTNG